MVVDARFFSECVFLLCYKASDSIGEVSRRAGMRACQLGREPETARGVRGPGPGRGRQGSRHRAQGRKGRGRRAQGRVRIRTSSPAAPGAFFSLLSDTLLLLGSDARAQAELQVELPALSWVRSPVLPSSMAEFPKVASRVGSPALPRVSACPGSQQPQRGRRGRGGAGAGGAS